MFVRIGWKSLPGTNTSLVLKFINYGQKSFITLAPGVNVVKLFDRNLLIFVIGYNIC